MRMKGKKPIFNYKDTWSLDMVLSPIIAEGLKKFLEVKRSDKSDYFGIPGGVIEEYRKRNNLPEDGWHHTNEDLAKADVLWEEILEEMIYAFEDKEPNPDDFGYNITLKDGQLVSTGDKEGFNKAMQEHEARVANGHELFGKFYKNLWW